MTFLPAALREAQTCRYLVYSEANFEVFRPAGATRCTDGGEIWHGPLLRAKFHRRCNDKGVGPPKLKFLLRFGRNLEYKRPAGACPLRDFHKTCRVCTPFQVRWVLKLGWICSRGYGVMGVLSSGGLFTPKFAVPPSGDTMGQAPKDLEVQERARGPLSPCQVWWGSDFTCRGGSQKR